MMEKYGMMEYQIHHVSPQWAYSELHQPFGWCKSECIPMGMLRLGRSQMILVTLLLLIFTPAFLYLWHI